jgi:large subunit ribosomal protein L15
MKLNELKPSSGSRKNRKRVGRGNGSGSGNTSGRGNKGQRARSGGKSQMPGFEGGQTPFWKKLPKRGFHNFTQKDYAWINLKTLEAYFNDGDEITPDVLKERRLIKQFRDGIKVLGDGELTKKLTIHAHKFTASAKEKIEAVGGQSVMLIVEEPPAEPKAKKKAKAAKADNAEQSAAKADAPKAEDSAAEADTAEDEG